MSPREYLISLGTQTLEHSGRTLYQHLCNVEDILRICRMDDDVCLAGLYHSIYGTNYYGIKTTNDRELIKSIIGEKAEYLVFLFCNADRPNCWGKGANQFKFFDGSYVNINNDVFEKLKFIDKVNHLEHGPILFRG
jgi:hypothetical protein